MYSYYLLKTRFVPFTTPLFNICDWHLLDLRIWIFQAC